MEIRKQAHVVYRAQYHIVWIPKYRHKILKSGVKEYAEIKLDEVRKYYPDIEYIERNVQIDHIHLVLSFPPKYSASKIVQILKTNTSASLKKKFDFIWDLYKGGSIWSVGYFFSTVGVDEQTIRNYIKHQEMEDLGQVQLDLFKKPRT